MMERMTFTGEFLSCHVVCITISLIFIFYRWEFSVNHTNGHSDERAAVVSVIDGSKILLTDFRHSVIPPPMCTTTVDTKNPVNFVGFQQFNSNNSQSKFFSIDSLGVLTTYTIQQDGKLEVVTSKDISTEVNEMVPLFVHHWIWLNDDTFIGAHNVDSIETNVLLFKVEDGQLLKRHSVKMTDTIVNMIASSRESVVAQSISGSMYELKIKDHQFEQPVELFQLPEFCEKALVYQNDKTLDIYSLKTKQYLFYNDRKIASDVTSMFMTERYLAFTTLDQLKFVRLADHEIVSDRRMERGGKLVIVIPKGSRTVLQMPRGNLEAIQPRVLSLCIVGELLDASEYRKAFDILRTQRINLNVLVDHNPIKFQSEIERFIDCIDNSQWLSLFLFDLQNADVTETMYSSNYAVTTTTNGKDKSFFENKIQIICGHICDALIAKKSTKTKFVLPIITAYVKQNQLEAAMMVISDLRKHSLSNNSNAKADDTDIDAQGALKYLLYLVDVNQLYNVALGMYDFDLVLFVATKSQKDPKEYLPFLNELKQLDESYRKFKIDSHLKRYHKALKHVVDCGADKFDECLKLVTTENLHAEAMRLYAGQPECYRKMAQAYAETLRSTGKARDACLMYERSGDLQQAILSAKHILDWEKCLTLAKQSNLPQEDVDQLIS